MRGLHFQTLFAVATGSIKSGNLDKSANLKTVGEKVISRGKSHGFVLSGEGGKIVIPSIYWAVIIIPTF